MPLGIMTTRTMLGFCKMVKIQDIFFQELPNHTKYGGQSSCNKTKSHKIVITQSNLVTDIFAVVITFVYILFTQEE